MGLDDYSGRALHALARRHRHVLAVAYEGIRRGLDFRYRHSYLGRSIQQSTRLASPQLSRGLRSEIFGHLHRFVQNHLFLHALVFVQQIREQVFRPPHLFVGFRFEQSASFRRLHPRNGKRLLQSESLINRIQDQGVRHA